MDAEATCMGNGGHLVSIGDESEQEKIVAMTDGMEEQVWLGFHEYPDYSW